MIMEFIRIGVSRLLSAVMEQHARLFVNKTPKGEFRYAWGINFPRLAPFDVQFGQCQGREALTLTDKSRANLLSAGYEVLVDDRS